ncbi:MAG: 50S ribosomal protein L35 [bacterium]|nr:50S ribosomal protein L35 [bacterium]
MPKLKTVKSAKKRVVGITKAGKIRVRKLSAQHLAMNKSSRARRQSKQTSTLGNTESKKVQRMIPYN